MDWSSFGWGVGAGAVLAFVVSAVAVAIMFRRVQLAPPMDVIDDAAGRHHRPDPDPHTGHVHGFDINRPHIRRQTRPGRPPRDVGGGNSWHL